MHTCHADVCVNARACTHTHTRRHALFVSLSLSLSPQGLPLKPLAIAAAACGQSSSLLAYLFGLYAFFPKKLFLLKGLFWSSFCTPSGCVTVELSCRTNSRVVILLPDNCCHAPDSFTTIAAVPASQCMRVSVRAFMCECESVCVFCP